MTFAIGSLVRARGRDWVVLPETAAEKDLLIVRPLGGAEREVTGIYIGPGPDGRPLEAVSSAEFRAPDPARDLGSDLSCRLLRDAARLDTRSAPGPFRCLGRIAIEPRPYQLVPLLMALRLDPVRLLIADDVGVGKTIEALLIARELLDRGEIQRMTVLCPPHLAEQWQRALADQFHLEAELVLAATAARLERQLASDESLFTRHPVTVVSTDYIKQEQRRFTFLRTCPELVIVDEAHGCADTGAGRAGHMRHAMLRQLLADDPRRHLLLVTATPHSGQAAAFRSLLGLLDPELGGLSEDLAGEGHRRDRERVARHLVQRRRGDLTSYMNATTPFPVRDVAEDTYDLAKPYRAFLDRVVAYCRESVLDKDLDVRRQRIRWWSALALLRAISSSPMAAAATLRTRASSADSAELEAIDEEGRRAVLDLDEESTEGLDVAPGAATDPDEAPRSARLRELAREAEALAGKSDAKLRRAVAIVAKLVEEGFSPIIFCRFIPTVEYVAAALRKKLKDATVEAISGSLPPEERERRVSELGRASRRVLVCTDCLSEGINLQDGFDAVMHYDLAWNPTRHEQREGRVDRYGQPRERVRTLTYYGANNPVDGIVLDVLLRKHRTIQQALGIAVPVPSDSALVGKAVMEGLILRTEKTATQLKLGEGVPGFAPEAELDVNVAWQAAADREKASRSLFRQHQLHKQIEDDLAGELAVLRRALGDDRDVERFVMTTLASLGLVPPKLAAGEAGGKRAIDVDLAKASAALRDALGGRARIAGCFRGRPPAGGELLVRTHPAVTGLASFVLESALDPALGGPGRRAGVIRTRAVTTRTTLLLLRLRIHLHTRTPGGEPRALLAEDLALAAFTGTPGKPTFLDDDAAEALLAAAPAANIDAAAARDHLAAILADLGALRPALGEIGRRRAADLLAAHKRVRRAARAADRAQRAELLEPVDVLGVYLLLPAGGAK
jgi:superfamily II DNA or RNA helicase